MTIEIHLIRSNSTRDDKIKIRRRHMRRDYLITYEDGLLNRTRWTMVRSRHDTMEYIDSILMFFQYDEDPFRIIQITLPGHPLIFVRRKDFDEEKRFMVSDLVYRQLVEPSASYHY